MKAFFINGSPRKIRVRDSGMREVIRNGRDLYCRLCVVSDYLSNDVI